MTMIRRFNWLRRFSLLKAAKEIMTPLLNPRWSATIVWSSCKAGAHLMIRAIVFYSICLHLQLGDSKARACQRGNCWISVLPILRGKTRAIRDSGAGKACRLSGTSALFSSLACRSLSPSTSLQAPKATLRASIHSFRHSHFRKRV